MDNFYKMEIETEDFRNDYEWVTIVDYSRFFNVSISTIRRKIKSRKVEFVVRNDMYFIRVLKSHLGERNNNKSLEMLKSENEKLKEEIQELKMLIEAYEKFN